MRIGLKDISRETGLSTSAVSRLLNGKRRADVDDPVRKRVLSVAKNLGYTPNHAARSLVLGRSNMVGLMLPDWTWWPYIARFEEMLDEKKLRVLPLVSHYSPDLELSRFNVLHERVVDSMFSLQYIKENESQYIDLANRGHKLVFRSEEDIKKHKNISCVKVNVGEGAYHIVNHLYSQGYRKIGFLGGFAAEDIKNGRFDRGLAKSYFKAYQEKHMMIDPSLAIPCETDSVKAYEIIIREFKQTPKKFDALIVQSTEKLLGVFKAINELGLRVPEDIGIATIGDDDSPRAIVLDVTTWSQPSTKVTSKMVDLLFSNSSKEKPQSYICESKLMIRRSTQRECVDKKF